MFSISPSAVFAKLKLKMKLLLVVLLVLVLAGAGGGWFYLKNRAQLQALDDDGDAPPAQAQPDPKFVPTFLPVDNMVVNLADADGDRFAQIGVTFELADAKTADQLRAYMPAVRSAMLLLISQRTATELLQRDGKEKLAADIMQEAARTLGYGASPSPPGAEESGGRRRSGPGAAGNPVRGVLFSSFIIQ